MITIEYKSLESLIPYARNSRTHSDEQVAQIAASIREFGWTNPVLIDGNNGLIAGHGRVMAARKLGIQEIPLTHHSVVLQKGKCRLGLTRRAFFCPKFQRNKRGDRWRKQATSRSSTCRLTA